ncbi:MAG: SDR family oxidoreductase [Proteobacteria bacterium]|nr:SDR family oxidoreductase [Pseudomonadota bacterium]
MPEESKTGALAGQRALVIGASSGIGMSSAGLLLADGADVTIAGRTEERLREAADSLRQSAPEGAGRLEWTLCDGMVVEDVRRAVDLAGGNAGLDIAVTIPGGNASFCPVLGLSEEDFESTVAHNLRPQFLVLKYAGLSMVGSGGGSIVAISSTAAIMTSRYLAGYCASKAAVDQLVRVAADELGEARVRVNAVRPGLTRTGGTGGLFEAEPILNRFLTEQPIPVGGEPEFIAKAVRFLAGPESGWVTGQCLTVDAGHTLRKFPDLTEMTKHAFGPERWEALFRGELT